MLWIDRVGNRRSWAILARYFSVENWGQAQRKIRTKKERKRRPVETDAAVEIRSQRGFPQRLGKHKTLSTVPTRPDGGFTYRIHFFRKAAVHLKHAFFWSEGWGAPQTIKRQVCQYQTVSTEGFTPNGASFLWQHGNDACVRSNRLAQGEIGIERKALYLVCRELHFHFGGV